MDIQKVLQELIELTQTILNSTDVKQRNTALDRMLELSRQIREHGGNQPLAGIRTTVEIVEKIQELGEQNKVAHNLYSVGHGEEFRTQIAKLSACISILKWVLGALDDFYIVYLENQQKKEKKR